jgi:hypothetical protein
LLYNSIDVSTQSEADACKIYSFMTYQIYRTF